MRGEQQPDGRQASRQASPPMERMRVWVRVRVSAFSHRCEQSAPRWLSTKRNVRPAQHQLVICTILVIIVLRQPTVLRRRSGLDWR